MIIRRLSPDLDLSDFRSGDEGLDRFLRRYAGQNQFRHHVGTTYVAWEDGFVAGFVTIAPGSSERDVLGGRHLPAYPLPILRLARLAVDERHQGRGLGTLLLGFVLGLARRLAEDFGCVGVVVDAMPDAVTFYERFGFMRMAVQRGASAARPTPIPMFLSTAEVLSASQPEDSDIAVFTSGVQQLASELGIPESRVREALVRLHDNLAAP